MDLKSPHLEDVAILPPAKNLELKLDEVGVENVQIQIRVNGQLIPAKAMASVSLDDPHRRGIHMSRIFKILTRLPEKDFSWPWLMTSLQDILQSQEALSQAAHLAIEFELPTQRQALVSRENGWRNYPVAYQVRTRNGKSQAQLRVRVLYSSTCPCSASLSRQALQAQFRRDFPAQEIAREEIWNWLGRATSMAAIPHSQRSEALCDFIFAASENIPDTLGLIDTIEETLGTPVQTAVKREDEQEFARRNSHHLMFCEDAARKLKVALLPRRELTDFYIEVRHFESLHAHDVVAKVSKFEAAAGQS